MLCKVTHCTRCVWANTSSASLGVTGRRGGLLSHAQKQSDVWCLQDIEASWRLRLFVQLHWKAVTTSDWCMPKWFITLLVWLTVPLQNTSLWAGVPLHVYMYSWHYHLSGFTALPQKHLFVSMKCVISKEHFSGWLLLWHNSRQFFILVHQLWRVWYACQWRQLAHGRLQCHETRLWVGRETPRDSPHNWIFPITTSGVYYT